MTTQAALLRRLSRLDRAELAALSDRERRATPNAVHLASALAKLADDDVAACGCGRRGVLRDVVGKYKPEHVCNAKCMTSSGPSCECSCGGANHGRANG